MFKLKRKLLTIVTMLGITTFFSCNKSLDDNNNDTSKIIDANYKVVSIGEFTAEEIGKLHNKVLQALVDANKLHADKNEQITCLMNANIDSRLSAQDFKSGINEFYNSNKVFENGSLKSLVNLQESILSNLVTKGIISNLAKNEIDNLSKLNLDEIIVRTNELLGSDKFTKEEKKYFATYTNIYEYSYKFWNTSLKSAQSWEPYAADAIGGILGLEGGPILSIVQASLLSAAFDE